ncbi:MAG: alkyl hydroperoxide reductase subunit F [Acholeplasmataceae bacterium]|nr:alkyl hydroperoxide reductase subunit F [Acholeplasmataceae bacterium]
MLLDNDVREKLSQYLQLMENDVLIKVSVADDPASHQMSEFVRELADLSAKIHVKETALARVPSFSINKVNQDTGITFAGIPLGHEFTSLVLALLQTSGYPPKIDASLVDQIKNIKGPFNFETYVSLTCHNCPDVVQALNIMSLLNPNISHTMVDGAIFKEEVEAKNILAVPSVYLNGEPFSSGRMELEEILAKLDIKPDLTGVEAKEPYDVLVIGGGPARTSSAIYAARKGLRTGLLAEKLGGQINDTFGIENFISIKYTEGPTLAANIEEHLRSYDIDVIKLQKVKTLKKADLIEIELVSGAILRSKTVIVATGARWRNINVPGEAEFKAKGVAYCPHCDGPLFKGKNVAVIGGGNSGVEAALDLAGLASHVTLLQASDKLTADEILQSRVYSKENITVITNAKTTEIFGSEKVQGLTYLDCLQNEQVKLAVDGIFIQIGLLPNTEWLQDTLDLNAFGEIVVDKYGATSIPGVFAAGDCTDCPYKQIIISMGAGANAALSAFDYLIRN